MTTAVQTVGVPNVWIARARFVVSTAIVWAGLHFAVGHLVLPTGLDRPLVLISAQPGPLAGLLLIPVLWVGAAVATIVLAARNQRGPLMVIGLALALWAFEGGRSGGTLDDWLILCHAEQGPATARAYWLLLGDYAYLLLAVAGAYVIAGMLSVRGSAGEEGASRPGEAPRAAAGAGALLIAAGVAVAAMVYLMGPNLADTRRGQVYFAVGVGFALGVYVARKVVKVETRLWYWPAPLVAGVVSAVVAAISPTLLIPEGYREINTIPAWGPVRALPIEMVGVGLLISMWMLPSSADEDSEERAS
jgi:hypothetical protein